MKTSDVSSPALEQRSLRTSLRRGFQRRCPVCGTGHLFRAYLKPVQNCGHCGLDIGEYRSDDAPPYFTIFIVGHIIGPALLYLEKYQHPPMWVHAALWLPLSVLLSLWFLPRVKGAVIGTMWTLRIKG